MIHKNAPSSHQVLHTMRCVSLLKTRRFRFSAVKPTFRSHKPPCNSFQTPWLRSPSPASWSRQAPLRSHRCTTWLRPECRRCGTWSIACRRRVARPRHLPSPATATRRHARRSATVAPRTVAWRTHFQRWHQWGFRRAVAAPATPRGRLRGSPTKSARGWASDTRWCPCPPPCRLHPPPPLTRTVQRHILCKWYALCRSHHQRL
jgi:hypothetical protein